MATPVKSWNAPLPEPDTQLTSSKPMRDGSETTKLVYSLLVNRVNPYLTAKRGQWFYQNLTLTPPLIEAALRGDMPIGIAAVSGTGTSRWFALDIDEDIQLFELQELARQLWDLDCVLFEYSRRGGHLFFFHRPAPWQQSQAFGRQLATEAGLPNIEVFPKSEGLNAIRLPGSAHPKTGEAYPIINPFTGEALHLGTALAAIKPYELPPFEVEPVAPGSRSSHSPSDFDWLVEALSALTTVTVYGPQRAKAVCLWHDDEKPSLLIKGSRFHCQRQDCVWGDRRDLEKWIRFGTRPPTH